MDLHKTLAVGKQLQGRADAGPALSQDNLATLGARLDKGLKWLMAEHDFTTAAAQDQWEKARATWCALADELDDRRGYPVGWTRNELDLVLAWVRGDECSPEVYHSWDGARVTGGRVVLCGTRYTLPCKLRLPEGTVIECVPHYRVGDETNARVYDLWALLDQFRLQRTFPGAQVVGDPAAYMKLLTQERGGV